MYCPTCATQNGDGTKFCRACGTNLSLVPQAITGRLPDAPRGRQHRRDLERNNPPSLASGISSIFMGLGFLAVTFALGLSGSGRGWWFWMLIPAFAMLGGGVAKLVSTLQAQRFHATSYTPMPQAVNNAALPPQPNFETLPPPSVTEGTTRHMTPVPERHRDSN